MRDDALSIIVSGSSAATGLPGYLIWLRQELSLDIRVLLTASAERFLPAQVASWYADEVYTSADQALNPTEFARRSLGVVALPTTANLLAGAALGLAATPAQTVLLAADRPALFFPSMSGTMWNKPTTRRYVETLRAEGHTVVDPISQPVYELWSRDNTVGPAMPTPDEATELIVKWLEQIAAEAEDPEDADA